MLLPTDVQYRVLLPAQVRRMVHLSVCSADLAHTRNWQQNDSIQHFISGLTCNISIMSEENNRFIDVSQSAGLSSRRSPIHEYAESFEREQTGTSASFTSQDEPTRTEGFDLDMFIKDPNVLKYQCAICRMVLRDPIQTQCGHRFCSMCINIWIRYCVAFP